MARSISQALIRTSNPSLFAIKSQSKPHVSRLLKLRNQSSQSETSQLVDPNLIDSDTERRDALIVQKMEEAIHGMIVRRSAPDWLPFRPGSSYFVPSRKGSYGIAQLVQKLANELTEEEVMSLTTARGWPSSAYFINDSSPPSAEVETASTNLSQSEGEEG